MRKSTAWALCVVVAYLMVLAALGAGKDRLEPSDGPVDAPVIHGTVLHRVYYFSNSSLKFFVGRGAVYTEAEIHTDDTTDVFDEDGDDILPRRLEAGDVVTVWRTGTHARRVERLGHTRSRNFD
jgi:hypothetical protein